MPDKTKGLVPKFEVRRTDGRDAPGEPHEHCFLFVLDVDHDPMAIPAIRAYAKAAIDSGYTKLGADLLRFVNGGREDQEAVRRKLQ